MCYIILVMSMKIFSCYSSGEGFYQLLKNNNPIVFFNVVFPCSIKDLYKSFDGKKDYNLKVLSVRSFIKLAALRDNYYFLSFFYPRGFISNIELSQVIGKFNFGKYQNDLANIGEVVALKVSPNVIVTVDYWKTDLHYGLILDYLVIIKILVFLLKLVFCFNHIVLKLLVSVSGNKYDNIKSVN